MKEITPIDAKNRLGGQMLLDVRKPDEGAAGHAPGAVHVPLGQLADAKLPEAEALIGACRSGGRSSQAVEAFHAAGCVAANFTGGMNAWAAADLPVVTDDGSPGTVI